MNPLEGKASMKNLLKMEPKPDTFESCDEEKPQKYIFERKGHATTDLSSRSLKALKIERLLNLQNKPNNAPIQLLEVGCGSGGISDYFATHPSLQCEVHAVDVNDNRKVSSPSGRIVDTT